MWVAYVGCNKKLTRKCVTNAVTYFRNVTARSTLLALPHHPPSWTPAANDPEKKQAQKSRKGYPEWVSLCSWGRFLSLSVAGNICFGLQHTANVQK